MKPPFTNRPAIESLEERRLCSTNSLAAHAAPVPFPSVVGVYQGSAVFLNGAVSAETLTVVKQKNGIFSGATTQVNGANGKLVGTISRTGKVHIVDRGTRVKFLSVGSGTFANNTFAIRFLAVQGKLRLAGTLTLSKAPN